MCCKSKFLTVGFLASVFLMGATLVTPKTAISQNETETKLLRHVVLFKFKDDASEQDVQKVVDAFKALPDKISEVHSFECGTDNSPEKLADGFTHCFLVTFKSEDDRAAYLPHPAHQAFVEVLKPHLDKVLVIDYWAEG